MKSQSTSQTVPVRLYGGADDDGTITLPMINGQAPVALFLSTGIYVATGLQDDAGNVLFANPGSERALWLKDCGVG